MTCDPCIFFFKALDNNIKQSCQANYIDSLNTCVRAAVEKVTEEQIPIIKQNAFSYLRARGEWQMGRKKL